MVHLLFHVSSFLCAKVMILRLVSRPHSALSAPFSFLVYSVRDEPSVRFKIPCTSASLITAAVEFHQIAGSTAFSLRIAVLMILNMRDDCSRAVVAMLIRSPSHVPRSTGRLRKRPYRTSESSGDRKSWANGGVFAAPIRLHSKRSSITSTGPRNALREPRSRRKRACMAPRARRNAASRTMRTVLPILSGEESHKAMEVFEGPDPTSEKRRTHGGLGESRAGDREGPATGVWTTSAAAISLLTNISAQSCKIPETCSSTAAQALQVTSLGSTSSLLLRRILDSL